jgi:ATP-binding cassette subfamily B protein
MLKLIRYLKPYIIFVFVAVVLLFIQALSELALPDYMSKIVNYGIQQGGIESAVPEALKKTTFEHLTLFMDEEEKKTALSLYTLVQSGTSEANLYADRFPILQKEDLYLLNDKETMNSEQYNDLFGKALLVISGIEKAKSEAVNGIMDLNGAKMPTALVYSLIGRMPQQQRLEMMETMDKMFSSMGDTMIRQAAVAAIKSEYETIGMNTDALQSRYIFNVGLLMIVIALLGTICTIAVGFIAAKIAAGVSRDIRQDVFEKIEKFSVYEFERFSTASLITRTTNDITQIQMVIVMVIRMVFYAPIMGVGGITRALEKSSSMSWIIALAVITLLGLIMIVFSVALPKFKKVQKLIDRLNLVTREALSGIMVIRAFITQKFEEKRFDQANRELTDTSLFIGRVMVTMMPIMMLIMNGVMLLIIWVGAHQIAESSLQVGDMMAFMQYAMQIIFSFLMLSMMFIMLPRASVSGARIAEVLEINPTITDPENPLSLPIHMVGEVEFRNVSFKFPGAEENALKNISFIASPGKTTAIIGSTGSGKTTLVNLIPRFYDASEGQITIDGYDIKTLAQKELRDKIGYVPQRGILFSGTIETNLKYADEHATSEEMEKAATVAQARDFIDQKPEKYAESISQGGTNVSGGQKQRLSIARALLKKPRIYIFDDSFSALDYKTDVSLRKALRTETADSTVIIVGQRVATIMNAEQILVLDEGQLVGKGTHKELMQNCRVYQEIALSQLSKEELA